jgi:hypothetical protein
MAVPLYVLSVAMLALSIVVYVSSRKSRDGASFPDAAVILMNVASIALFVAASLL